MNYTEKEIKDTFNQELNSVGLSKMYCSKIVNYKGKTTDSKKFYTEIISECILENFENGTINFNTIDSINRESGYKVISHHKNNLKITNTNRKEEILAKNLFKNKTFINGLGQVIDFQIPLKNSHEDEVGKVDLISYNEKNNIAYLIELKCGNNNETLLRSVLEISTYFQKLNHIKFFESFDEFKNKPELKKAILLTKESRANKEFQILIERPNLKKLIDKLKIEIFILE